MQLNKQKKSVMVSKGWHSTTTRVPVTNNVGHVRFVPVSKWMHPQLAPTPISFTQAKLIAFPPAAQLTIL